MRVQSATFDTERNAVAIRVARVTPELAGDLEWDSQWSRRS